MTLLLCVILVALVFEYINGFHDAANAIATVVSTKVLTPRQAICLAAVCNLIGAFVGVEVAKTVGGGLLDTKFVTMTTVLCGLMGGILWNLLTWWLGLPSSSSHALVGGLCGAALASANNDWAVLKWSVIKTATVKTVDPTTGAVLEQTIQKMDGLWPKVVVPMFTSPFCGFLLGFIFMGIFLYLFRSWRPTVVNVVFGKLQILSAAYMGLSHGTNDAQKTMGIITLALVTATQSGALDGLPDWLHFLRLTEFKEIPRWVVIACALTMALGTAGGGWRIIRTLGHKMIKLQPLHGFAAETAAATILMLAAKLGMPVSTTHAISTSIMGVGATKRFSAIRWGLVERILWTWVLTLPMTALAGYLMMRLVKAL